MAPNATKAAIEATRDDDCEGIVKMDGNKLRVEWDEADTTTVPEDLIQTDMFLISPTRTIRNGLALFAKRKNR